MSPRKELLKGVGSRSGFVCGQKGCVSWISSIDNISLICCLLSPGCVGSGDHVPPANFSLVWNSKMVIQGGWTGWLNNCLVEQAVPFGWVGEPTNLRAIFGHVPVTNTRGKTESHTVVQNVTTISHEKDVTISNKCHIHVLNDQEPKVKHHS